MTANHRPRRRFNYSNVMSTLAVFLVIAGGSALAAALPKNSVKSKTVKDNSLKSKDLEDGKAVTAADVDASQVQLRVGKSCPAGEAIRVINVDGGVLCEKDDQGAGNGGPPSGPAGGDLTGTYPNPAIAPGAVNSAQVANESLTRDDLGPNSVSSAEIEDGGVDTAEIEDNGLLGADIADNTLTGADINESSLGQVPSALLGGFGRTGAESTCDPESTTFATCAATPVINVPPGASALILARVVATSEATADSGIGECRLGTSSTGVVPNTTMTFATFEDDLLRHPATLVGVTPSLPAGATSFGIDCNQLPNFGAIEYFEVSATVLLITAN